MMMQILDVVLIDVMLFLPLCGMTVVVRHTVNLICALW